jgi:hypothetical protein
MCLLPVLFSFLNLVLPLNSSQNQVSVIVSGKICFQKNYEPISDEISPFDEILLEIVEPEPGTPISFKPDSQGSFKIQLTPTQLKDLKNPRSIKLKITCMGYKTAYLNIGPLGHTNHQYVEDINTIQLKPNLCPVTFNTNLKSRGEQLVLEDRTLTGIPNLRVTLQNKTEKVLVFNEIAIKSKITERFLGDTDLEQIVPSDIAVNYKLDGVTFKQMKYKFNAQGVGEFNFTLVPAEWPKKKIETRVWIQLRTMDGEYIWIDPFIIRF